MATSTLKILREVNDYSQDFIAEDILGISQPTYARLEQNPSKITAEQAQKLSDLYKVSIANLLSEATPVITFRQNDVHENTNGINGNLQSQIIQNHESEVKSLKDEIGFLRNQVADLLKMVGNKLSSGN